MKTKILILGLIAFTASVFSGCVSREMHITSEPSGAKVLINDTYKGITPMTHKFVHYQVFGIRVEKEGYHPLYVEETVKAPLYEKPGIDLISEAFIPKHYHDKREFHYVLEKIEEVDDIDKVMENASAMRKKVSTLAKESKKKDSEKSHITLPLPLKKSVKEAEEQEKALEAAKANKETKTDEGKKETAVEK
jgi:hypothetical protein